MAIDSVTDGLEIANSLPYGLAAYGYTDSAATAEQLIAGFEAGILSINHCGGSIPNAPSGGVKESGYGKEGGHEGLNGYLVTKRVSHKLYIDGPAGARGSGGRPPGKQSGGVVPPRQA
jgi:succinate-semialdehyde dehydrogenase/glutarate-semialdehyde dehydrogenase